MFGRCASCEQVLRSLCVWAVFKCCFLIFVKGSLLFSLCVLVSMYRLPSVVKDLAVGWVVVSMNLPVFWILMFRVCTYMFYIAVRSLFRNAAVLVVSMPFMVCAYAVSIMPLGDSITEGFTSSGEAVACSYRTDFVNGLGNCQVDLVGSRNSPYQNPNGGACVSVNVNHEGHSGYSTSNYMDTALFGGTTRVRYWVDQADPDMVLLHIGSNDMSNGTGSFQVGEYDPATNSGTFTIGRISSMIDEIYASNPSATVYVGSVIPWFALPADINSRISQLRPELQLMVGDRFSDGDAIKYVNVHSGFTPSMMQGDAIHPNPIGEEHIAAKFLEALHDDGICTPDLEIIHPAGSVLQGTTQSFVWQFDNMNSDYVEQWEIKAGSNPGASDYAIESGSGSQSEAVLTGLPDGGQQVYISVRMEYFTGEWFSASRVYSAGAVQEDYCNGELVTVYVGNGDVATSGDDVILGTEVADDIYGLGGNDTICGLGGSDLIVAGDGNDWVDAGPGGDEVQGGRGRDEIYGGDGNDTLFGGLHADLLDGGSGGDLVSGNSGNDTLYGGPGVDEIIGGTGNDSIYTGDGGTVGTGLLVSGGEGNDVIRGGNHPDAIRGGNGDDILYGNGGNDEIYGGNDKDRIYGQSGNDLIKGDAGADTLVGGPGNDNVSGNSGNDDISGGGGNDVLTGHGGNDQIYGDRGSDVLRGGPGSDQCVGGDGTDSANSTCESISEVP